MYPEQFTTKTAKENSTKSMFCCETVKTITGTNKENI